MLFSFVGQAAPVQMSLHPQLQFQERASSAPTSVSAATFSAAMQLYQTTLQYASKQLSLLAPQSQTGVSQGRSVVVAALSSVLQQAYCAMQSVAKTLRPANDGVGFALAAQSAGSQAFDPGALNWSDTGIPGVNAGLCSAYAANSLPALALFTTANGLSLLEQHSTPDVAQYLTPHQNQLFELLGANREAVQLAATAALGTATLQDMRDVLCTLSKLCYILVSTEWVQQQPEATATGVVRQLCALLPVAVKQWLSDMPLSSGHLDATYGLTHLARRLCSDVIRGGLAANSHSAGLHSCVASLVIKCLAMLQQQPLEGHSPSAQSTGATGSTSDSRSSNAWDGSSSGTGSDRGSSSTGCSTETNSTAAGRDSTRGNSNSTNSASQITT